MGVPYDIELKSWHVIDRQSAEVAVGNTTDPTAIYTFTIPKAWFTYPDVCFRLKASGTFKQDPTSTNANDFTFDAKLASTAICTAIGEVARLADVIGSWTLELFMACGMGKAQDWTIAWVGTRSAAGTASKLIQVNRGAGSVDMTAADKVFTVNVTLEEADAETYVKCEELTFEMLLPDSRPA